jgi:Fe-S-cluster-containing hydrogenase component 2
LKSRYTFHGEPACKFIFTKNIDIQDAFVLRMNKPKQPLNPSTKRNDMSEIYHRLASHLAGLVMGYPYSEGLMNLLKEMFTTEEAGVLLGIPNDLKPLETASCNKIAGRLGRSPKEIEPILKRLAHKNLVFSAPTPEAKPGYGLLQVGYGMPQTSFWHGRQDKRAARMAKLVARYFRPNITQEVYGKGKTKSYRYVPVGQEVKAPIQGVMPYDHMEQIVQQAEKIAVAHCPCRVSARAAGFTDCNHSLETCIKYDQMAEFVIERRLGRPISQDEAMYILGNCETEGLVHMVDNAQGEINHTCNCCGCYCWNVGLIRRRKIPRDALMAVHYLRRTEMEACIGCGACAEICPVNAVTMHEDRPMVDENWCIGCGVCAGPCPTEAISLENRELKRPAQDVNEMFERIRREKGLKK